MRLRARHYRTGQRVDLAIHAGRIASVAPADGQPVSREAAWIAPAFFDLQINGALGIGFVSPTLDTAGIRTVAQACARHGIAAFCPTLITASQDAVLAGFTALRRAREEDPPLARAMPCFHLEGPYISPDDGPRGAHPLAHVRPPDRGEFARLQESAGGLIRLVTLAPERPGALPFIEWLAKQRIVVAIGHTAATPEEIRAAVDAGARLSTHLGNGSHAVLPRHPNYIWEQMAEDRLMASLIPDG